jgi:hypothetical protein
MLSTTLDVFKAALRSDPTVSASDRNRLLAVLRNGSNPSDGGSVTSQPPGIVRPKTAALRLGRSVRAVHQLAAQGLLQKVKFPGRTRCAGITTESLASLLKGETP